LSVILVNPPSLYRTPGFGLSYFELSRRELGADGIWSLPGEHLGLRSIEASCAAHGITADVVNGQALFHRSTAQTWDSIQASARRNGTPVLVGFTGPCQVFGENLELAALVKRTWPGCRTILGHDFATLNYPRILDQHREFDFACAGEGEHTFRSLAAALLEGRSPAGIPGLVAPGQVAKPGPALDLDELPWPSRGDLAAVVAGGLSPAVFTSRGCPYQCSYCCTGEVAGQRAGLDRHRLKSIDNVFAEIEQLVKGHGVRFISITDDLFLTKSPGSRERAENLARRLITARLDVGFMADVRVDSIDRDILRLLHDAGLRRIFVGVETSSPEQLDFYNKRYTRRADRRSYIHRQLAIPGEVGIDVLPGIITYHAESTMAELRDTLDLIDACDLKSAYSFLNRLIAYPGTGVYRRYLERGLLVEDWPVPAWRFADARLATVEESIRDAIGRGAPFADVRALFASLVSQESTVAQEPTAAGAS
jgi:radical SAM superfamily enzyme YgiQ (UPF0313 family)